MTSLEPIRIAGANPASIAPQSRPLALTIVPEDVRPLHLAIAARANNALTSSHLKGVIRAADLINANLRNALAWDTLGRNKKEIFEGANRAYAEDAWRALTKLETLLKSHVHAGPERQRGLARQALEAVRKPLSIMDPIYENIQRYRPGSGETLYHL